MRALIIVLTLLASYTLAEAQSTIGTFKIRRGTEVVTRTRDFDTDTVTTFWYFGGRWDWWCAGVQPMRAPQFAIRLGYTTPYEISHLEEPQRFHMTELGLLKHTNKKLLQYLGFNASINPRSYFYGVEFYAMKRIIGIQSKNKDIVLAGLGATMFSNRGEAVYGLKPYLGFTIPVNWLSNFQLDAGYHLFLNKNKITPNNTWYGSLSFKYPIFGRY